MLEAALGMSLDLDLVSNGAFHRDPGGRPWRDLPPCYKDWKTVYNLHPGWSADGTWARILDALRAGKGRRGGLDGRGGRVTGKRSSRSTRAGPGRGDPGPRRRDGGGQSAAPRRACLSLNHSGGSAVSVAVVLIAATVGRMAGLTKSALPTANAVTSKIAWVVADAKILMLRPALMPVSEKFAMVWPVTKLIDDVGGRGSLGYTLTKPAARGPVTVMLPKTAPGANTKSVKSRVIVLPARSRPAESNFPTGSVTRARPEAERVSSARCGKTGIGWVAQMSV